ncbi:oligosaccharide flippase family protein [Zunongwangia sp. HRR-M8]|uniref:oligosaccharide flippase family protein n=1 Tax=Zunongwangia sp. HRR-M8 TaxID=3015170 RepID=UPI0022DD6961|nr:oligosaccharide flippase family protein [Zunongwangia sp. HRR-M8]WBL22416.1 oligosaccharide flippase family protein [Zunongwangia sp. HRR-M8]
MSTLKRFFQDTIIYGIATVVPRLLNFILVPLHTEILGTGHYSINTTFYIWAAFFNVLLTYGMETSFFRFFSRAEEKQKVFSTSFIALTITTLLFFGLGMLFRDPFISFLDLDPFFFNILFTVLILDTLVVVPFAYLRATNRPLRFASIKIINVSIVFSINLYLLWLVPRFPAVAPQYILDHFSEKDILGYIFLANLAASIVTFIILLPYFFKTKIQFSFSLLKQMWKYGWPIMLAGISFIINENLDKLLLKDILSEEIMGAYSGCYKLAVFMMIYIQAFKMGAEPFFFNHAKAKNAKTTYAKILNYFVITGGLILLVLVSFIDVFKEYLIRDEDYWVAMSIVPVILLANLFLGIYHNLSVWYKLTDKTRMGMYISLFGALITIVINVTLIGSYGFMVAAWATLAAYGSMMLISYFFGRKYYRVPYNVKKIGFYLLLSITLSAISFIYFRQNYIVAVLFVLIFVGITYFKEQEDIKKILKRS